MLDCNSKDEVWRDGREGDRERRSHSSRSIGVPEVIGNDKVGKMREREGWKKVERRGEAGRRRRPSGRDTPKGSMEDHVRAKTESQARKLNNVKVTDDVDESNLEQVCKAVI